MDPAGELLLLQPQPSTSRSQAWAQKSCVAATRMSEVPTNSNQRQGAVPSLGCTLASPGQELGPGDESSQPYSTFIPSGSPKSYTAHMTAPPTTVQLTPLCTHNPRAAHVVCPVPPPRSHIHSSAPRFQHTHTHTAPPDAFAALPESPQGPHRHRQI